MEDQPEGRETRCQEIGDRLPAIRVRIDDLQQPRESRAATGSTELLVEAQDHAAASEAAAYRALARSIEGLLRAAETHERCATSHERLAMSLDSNEEYHRQQARTHRAAAAADRQRAETARSLLPGRAGKGPRPGLPLYGG